MCGIVAWFSNTPDQFAEKSDRIRHRGPDTSSSLTLEGVALHFHRLAINGLDPASNQPFTVGEWCVVCNGEIYNARILTERFPCASKSDCEVIPQMFAAGEDAKAVCSQLDGVFAFVAVHTPSKQAVVARDPFGVRALYVGRSNGMFGVASEAKVLHDACDDVFPFPPGSFALVDYSDLENVRVETTRYTQPLADYRPTFFRENYLLRACRHILRAAVQKRLMADRLPIGCFLSGGLDSSIVCALLCEFIDPAQLHTFAIGMEGGTDLRHARTVAEYFGTTHHEVIVTEDEMLAAVPRVVKQIESWDTTTVRASTPMFLLSEWITANTDVRVVFSGEGSDELSGSYLYFRNAPSVEAYQAECVRLCEDLHRYDVLRADKSTAGHGLEVRVPFLDRNFVHFYLRADPALRRPLNGVEKPLLRKAFEGRLPSEVVWRVKEAFSDGVSGERSWYQVADEHAKHLGKKDEASWYRSLFDEAYFGRRDWIPYQWLPKWCGDVTNPSARVLTTYNAMG